MESIEHPLICCFDVSQRQDLGLPRNAASTSPPPTTHTTTILVEGKLEAGGDYFRYGSTAPCLTTGSMWCFMVLR